jgi:hypothetical protein
VIDVASEYAVSATRQGSQTGFYTSGPDYIESTEGAEVAGANGLGDAEREQFRTVAGRVLDRWSRSQMEQREITDSAGAVSTEEYV